MSLQKSDIEKRIPHLFERQVFAHPHHTAFKHGEVSVSYQDLSRHVDKVAATVITYQPNPEKPVLVLMEPGLSSVAAFIGILKAGAICAWVDRSNPHNRLRSIIDNLEPGLCLADPNSFEMAQSFADGLYPTVLYDKTKDLADIAPNTQILKSHPAVLVYTSGSTGIPKGVLHDEKSLVHVVWLHAQRLRLGAADRTLYLPSSTGIAGALLILRTLLTGGTLVQFSFESMGGQELVRVINDSGITSLTMVPSLFREMMSSLEEKEKLPTLRTIILGGEPLLAEDINKFQQHCSPECTLLNTYGCTEIPTFRTFSIDMTTVLSWKQVPVGYPVEDKEVVLLDDNNHPVPPGEEGEIAIRSAFIARGYWRNQEETSRKFLPATDSSELRMYRTGDQGYFLPNNLLMCVGRRDQQVKVMGNRVELGEIEHVLSQHPCVIRAALIAKTNQADTTFLVAFVEADQSSKFDETQLRQFLIDRLPTYMIPAQISKVPSLPLTPNGKINREALNDLDPEKAGKTEPYSSPTTSLTELGKSLAKIWSEVLKCRVIEPSTNFFVIGGDSLSVTRVVGRVHKEFQVNILPRTLFEFPTLAEFAEAVQRAKTHARKNHIPPLRPANKDRPIPLSFAQQRLWFLAQWEPQSVAYHMPYAWRLRGSVNEEALATAFTELVARHESLRTTFDRIHDQPVQVIHSPRPNSLPMIDLSSLEETAQEQEYSRIIDDDTHRCFDLTTGPLFRSTLLRLGQRNYILLVTLHHIITDGWSMGIFWEELSKNYTAEITGTLPGLSPLPLQYADFAVWQRQYLEGEVLARQIAYWTRHLVDAAPALELPTDAPRPPQQSSQGSNISFSLSPALTQELKALSRQNDTTLFMTLLTAFQILLARYSGQRDILVGTPIAGRSGPELETLIGFFANTLIVRTTFDGHPSFLTVLQQVRETCLNSYEHQDLPFEKLVEELQPVRDMSRHPLFQVMFQLVTQRNRPPVLPKIEVTSYSCPTHTAKFDLNCTVREQASELWGDLEYSTDLFEEMTVTRMMEHFHTLLTEILKNPDQSIFHIPYLTDTERQQILIDWNPQFQDLSAPACLHHLFEEQVEQTPDTVAAIYDREHLTYTALNTRANQLAYDLQQQGVGPEGCVGICLNRSLDVVVSILGVLKAGGVCVPLDPTYPSKRLSFMAKQAHVGLIITESSLSSVLPEYNGPFLFMEQKGRTFSQDARSVQSPRLDSENLVYVLYTSGSTGYPKGVALSHGALVNLIVWNQGIFPRVQRTLQFASIGFDVSFLEIFSTLSGGGTIVLVSDELRRDTTKLIDCLIQERIERAILPSALFNQLGTQKALSKMDATALTDIISTGDQLQISSEIASQFTHLTRCRLHNYYGPTESHVVTVYTLPGNPKDWSELPPIGSPITNTQVWLVDQEGSLVPPKIVGEIQIGGVCLARGYINQPDLTAERFRPSPLDTISGARVYKTGDQGKYDRSGALHFLGRQDHQVKLRGYRIELAEIEMALGEQAGIQEVLVICREDSPGEKQLVAYMVLNHQGTTDIAALHAALKLRLPEYMLPTSFVFLERFPLTSNKKIDRKTLPLPDSSHRALAPTYEAPASAIEEFLAAIWQELLNVPRIGRHDNFFTLGGHSLLATQLKARLYDDHEIDISLRLLFEHPTLAEQAGAIQNTLFQEIDHLSDSELEKRMDTHPSD